MESSGLSRRRVGGNSTTTSSTVIQDDDDINGRASPRAGSSSNDNNNSHSPSSTMRVSHAGSAFAGGTKIAVDPKDLEREGEDMKNGGKLPRLTIMEEVLLLGLKDKQGYLSFWNDNISYALRGCILLELALRRRIAIARDPNRRRVPLSDRLIEVIDERLTGETILDEALKVIKGQEEAKMGVNAWIDLLSGETWNVLKIGFQLKQVRERLAKGLVDKGVLRTEKRNFLLFDMATHPVADARTKESIVNRCVALLTSQTQAIPPNALSKEGEQCRVTRIACLVCAAYAASVLDNAFVRLGYEEREAAFQRCDDILGELSNWPFGASNPSTNGQTRKRAGQTKIGAGSNGVSDKEIVKGVVEGVKNDMQLSGLGASDGEDLCFELISAVLDVLSRLDSLL